MIVGLVLTVMVVVAAASKDGVGLSKISLPSGPGSIEGLGDAFEPQLNSGTSAYSVNVAVPPGVAGLQPEVTLRYNAGGGNGPFGLAWGWSPMSIRRQTEKGLPTYTENDVFTFQGEELVALTDGSYRVENEAGFMRITRGGEGWEVRDRAGTVYRLGQSAAARQARPGSASFHGTFEWYLEEQLDVHGNRMEFHYTAYEDSPGQLYCTEIRYSISRTDPGVFHSVVFDYEPRPDAFSSFLSGFEVKTGRRCREIRVLSRGGLVRRYGLSYELPAGDPLEPVRPEDVGLNFSLLRQVTPFDHRSPGQASYLPPLRLAYTRMDTAAGRLGEVTGMPPRSLADPGLAFGDINCDALPDLLYTDARTGEHVVYYNLGEGAFGPGTKFVSYPFPATLDHADTELADYDGDGRIDLVQKTGGTSRFVYYANTTGPVGHDESRPAWGLERAFVGETPPFELGDPDVRTLDLDGDKRMDFMRTTDFGFLYFYNRGDRWVQDGIRLFGDPTMGDLTAGSGIQFSQVGPGGGLVPNPWVKLADMNGDRLLDLVKLTLGGTRLSVTYWPNRGRAAWAAHRGMVGEIDLGVVPLEDVFVMDLNGDGLGEVVAVGADRIHFWINRGDGSFSARFERAGMPSYVKGETVLRQTDVNGNGSTDFVWENWDTDRGRFRVRYYDFLGQGKPNLLRVIDNGIGLRTEIEYRSSTDDYVAARKAGHPWRTRLPFASTVVSRITKRFGLDLDAVPGPDEYVTEFSYRDGYYDGFEKEFRGFAFAKKVERGDDRFEGIPVHSPTTVTRYAFHTGTPDHLDNNGDGRFDEADEQGGYEEEGLKGKVLWTEITLPTADVGGPFPAQMDGQPAEDSVVFTREYQTWKLKTVHSPEGGFTYRNADGTERPELSLPFGTVDGKKVSFAYLAEETTEVIEANGALAGTDPFTPVRGPKQRHRESEVDFFGNTIVERDYGEHGPGSVYDDERFTFTEHAFNLEDWLIGLPARVRVTDEAGGFVSENRRYYDGADFVGLGLGQVGRRGLVAREESLVNGAELPPALDDTPSAASNRVGDPRLPPRATVTTSRTRYDAYGNPVVTRDPLWAGPGQGHERRYEFDPAFHSFVERETIEVGGTNADLVVTATYDYAGAVITGFTDFNGNRTSYQYDSFYRLVGIVKPGDTEALPTQTFAYRPGDVFRGLYYEYDPSGALTLTPTAHPHVVSAVSTRAREQAGTTNTFDVTAYTDGAGHKLGVVEEGEIDGQFIYKDVKRYTSRGQERSAYLPFLSQAGEYQEPPVNIAHVDLFYDAAGRVVRSVNPPETHVPDAPRGEARTVYLPWETRLFDEEDTHPASVHFDTPHVQYMDGLDRLIGVDEVVKLTDLGEAQAAHAVWETRYQYNLQDKLTGITDSQGNRKWFRYDGLGRKIFMNDPDRGVLSWTYDEGSNLTRTEDAKGQVITYTYDGVNRLRTEDYLDEGSPEFSYGRSPDVIYHYDRPAGALDPGDHVLVAATNTAGYLSWVEDPAGEEHTSYDARARVGWVVKRIRDPQHGQLVNFRTGFRYDSLDRLTRLQYADNDEVQYAYNRRNLPRRIFGDIAGDLVGNIRYIETDQIKAIDYGNGVRTTYDYDPRQRLIDLHTERLRDGHDLIHFAYTFDRASNILRIDDRRPGEAVPAGDARRNTQIFDYDNLYRLTRARYSFNLPGEGDRNDGLIDYRYDRIGNMLKQTSDIVHVERGRSVTDLGQMDSGGGAGRHQRLGRPRGAAPGPHALTQIRNPKSEIRNYEYDANGNMTFLDGMTNTWDFKDRLVAVENDEMRAEYRYDYTDRRIWKRVHWKTASTNNVTGANPGYVLYPDRYFEMREHEAPVKYVWNGETRVARVTSNINSEEGRIQRFRVVKGWNLIGLAIDGSRPAAELAYGVDQNAVTYVLKWDGTSMSWGAVEASEPLPSGTVLWLHTAKAATLAAIGRYVKPGAVLLRVGPNFVSGWGLRPFKLVDPALNMLGVWEYGLQASQWQPRSPIDTISLADFTGLAAAGTAVYARAEVATTLLEPEGDLEKAYYHHDNIGSSPMVTDAKGDVTRNVGYYAFGAARTGHRAEPLWADYGFLQKAQGEEGGLFYSEARYLASSFGRFVSVDRLTMAAQAAPIRDPQQAHAYCYVENRPTKCVDLDGFASEIGRHLAQQARAFVNVPYVTWGRWHKNGSAKGGHYTQWVHYHHHEIYGMYTTVTSGLDCAGLVHAALQRAGVKTDKSTLKAFQGSPSEVAESVAGMLTATGYRVQKAIKVEASGHTYDAYRKLAKTGDVVFVEGKSGGKNYGHMGIVTVGASGEIWITHASGRYGTPGEVSGKVVTESLSKSSFRSRMQNEKGTFSIVRAEDQTSSPPPQ